MKSLFTDFSDLLMGNLWLYVALCFVVFVSVFFIFVALTQSDNLSMFFTLIVLGILMYIGFMNFLPKEVLEPALDNKVNISFYNDSDEQSSIRYKIVLNYESTEDLYTRIPADQQVYSISLEDQYGELREMQMFPKSTPDELSLPEVFPIVVLEPKDSYNLWFNVNYPEEEFKNKIRFEVKAIVEKLIDNKWVPYHQMVFMERGPYWSLDKGPIEEIPN